MDTLEANHGVLRLEAFRRKKRSRAKMTNMQGKVRKEVKLWFVEPIKRPSCCCFQEFTDSKSEQSLLFTDQLTAGE